MTQHTLVQTLTDLATPLAASLGLSLWGVELIFGGRGIVRIFVEDERNARDEPVQKAELSGQGHGVTIDQCAELSRVLGLALEVEDCMPGAYVLEVSSPGLDRIFFTAGQLAGAVGGVVEITLFEASQSFPGRRKFRGRLIAAPSANAPGKDPGQEFFLMRLEDAALPGEDGAEFSFAFAEVKKARQVHVVPEKVLPGKGGKKKDKADAGGKSAKPRKDKD